jgi:hypothetical protein
MRRVFPTAVLRSATAPAHTTALLVATALLTATALVLVGGPAEARDLVVSTTGEAATAQPMVVLALGDKPTAPSGKKDDLSDLIGDMPAVAILDTGASGHVLSQATAERFGVVAETGSRYVETGMSGAHPMTVSRPITLAVSDLEPEDDDHPGRRTLPTPFRLSTQRLLLNDAPTDLSALLTSPGSLVDVVGMPLIRERVVEIAPADGAPALTVRLHPSAAGLRVDAWVPLDLVDFNRPDPRNRGPAPSLATNPVVPEVGSVLGASSTEGAWLLDTGAACTMISTATARRLGLVDADGHATHPPEFTLPVGGVGGGSSNLPGFHLDRITLPADDGQRLVFEHAAVVVHDVTAVRTDGTRVTLDGVLGMNLLLPSGNGITMLGVATEVPAPFARVVIDVARTRLGLTVAD